MVLPLQQGTVKVASSATPHPTSVNPKSHMAAFEKHQEVVEAV
jgi:hypothetical protein